MLWPQNHEVTPPFASTSAWAARSFGPPLSGCGAEELVVAEHQQALRAVRLVANRIPGCGELVFADLRLDLRRRRAPFVGRLEVPDEASRRVCQRSRRLAKGVD